MRPLTSTIRSLPILRSSAGARQFLKFGVVGMANTLIDAAVFFLLVHYTDIHYLIANVISFSLAAINSYTLNRRWTFRSQAANVGREMSKYFMVIGLGFIWNEILLFIGVEHFHWHEFLAKAVAIGVVLMWNFFINRLWTFRRPPLPESKQ